MAKEMVGFATHYDFSSKILDNVKSKVGEVKAKILSGEIVFSYEIE